MGVFVPNPGFALAALRSSAVKNKLEALVEEGARRASELAPDDPATGSPDLHSSVVGEVILTGQGYLGRVIATDYKGMFYEFGTSRNEPRPFLRPALEGMGLELGPEERKSKA